MPVPKKRLTSTRSGNRRSHLALTAPVFNVCSNCGTALRPHTVCMSCGFYKGKKVIPERTAKK